MASTNGAVVTVATTKAEEQQEQERSVHGSQSQDENNSSENRSHIIFVGSGSSTGTPRLPCLMRRPITCKVCLDALQPFSKNRRRNPSILIQHNNYNILIDCGKSFREACVELLTRHHIQRIDAVITTHGHADAFLGLDDLREFCWEQKAPRSADHRSSSISVIPIYVRSCDMTTISNAFPYLVDSSKATGSGYVSQLDFKTFDDKPFSVFGLTFTPFNLHHGHNSTCAGFRFGNVVYLSDISGMSNRTRERIIQSGPIDVLVIDALHPTEPNRSHYSLPQAIDEVNRLKPSRTYFIGMSHAFDYDSTNRRLQQEHPQLNAQLSYDCLKIELPLTSSQPKL